MLKIFRLTLFLFFSALSRWIFFFHHGADPCVGDNSHLTLSRTFSPRISGGKCKSTIAKRHWPQLHGFCRVGKRLKITDSHWIRTRDQTRKKAWPVEQTNDSFYISLKLSSIQSLHLASATPRQLFLQCLGKITTKSTALMELRVLQRGVVSCSIEKNSS